MNDIQGSAQLLKLAPKSIGMTDLEDETNWNVIILSVFSANQSYTKIEKSLEIEQHTCRHCLRKFETKHNVSLC